MRVMVFFSVHPIKQRGSMADDIAQAVEIIRESGLEHEVGPSGTTILGEFSEVMDVIERCHERLGEDGTRVNSELMIDAKPGLDSGELQARVQRVEERLEEPAQPV